MAITINITNDNPIILGEIACAQDVINLSIPDSQPTVETCLCKFRCEWEELVFHTLEGGEDEIRSVLIELVDSAGTFEFRLFKSGSEIATLDNNDLGEFFDLGDIEDHPLKAGYQLDFEKVFTAHGSGLYYVEVDITNFSRQVIERTQSYRLSPFSEASAHGTVKLETTHDGNIQGGFDYTGMEWYKAVRLKGGVTQKAPSFEESSYLDSQRIIQNIQNQILTS